MDGCMDLMIRSRELCSSQSGWMEIAQEGADAKTGKKKWGRTEGPHPLLLRSAVAHRLGLAILFLFMRRATPHDRAIYIKLLCD
jgi:hypothetical protein